MKRKLIYGVKISCSILMVGLIIGFIYVSFKENQIGLSEITNMLYWPLLLVAILFLMLYYFSSSVAWRDLISDSICTSPLSLSKSFGIVNISGLTKYLPGKIWSYAIQIYILIKQGVTLSRAVFCNLIHLILTVTTPILFFLPVYAFYILKNESKLLQWSIMSLGLLLYCVGLILAPRLLQLGVHFLNRFRKEKVIYIPMSVRSIMKIQGILIGAYSFYLFSLLCIVYGLGFTQSFLEALCIASICLFSMIVGFIFVIIPGGLGIQESLIYELVRGTQNTTFSLALPIAFRIVSIVTDVIVGVLSLVLIKTEIRQFYVDKKSSSKEVVEN